MEIQQHSIQALIFRSLKRTRDTFIFNQENSPPLDKNLLLKINNIKARDSYGEIVNIVKKNPDAHCKNPEEDKVDPSPPGDESFIKNQKSEAIMPYTSSQLTFNTAVTTRNSNSPAMPQKRTLTMAKPKWHAPWKLYRVISGHQGWVRCCAVEPSNRLFATGSNDSVIKIWDLAKGTLQLSLTGHVGGVRGLAFSHKHPYLFSCGDDGQAKCWDVTRNESIRSFHGHLSAVYSVALYEPDSSRAATLLVTAGRDSTVRVWDVRTKTSVHTLVGHTNAVASVICQTAEPQIISSSYDCTIRLWDLTAGKSKCTLTNHKKSVRAVALHPSLYMFASASADNIKQWKCPEGQFIQNLSGHNFIINCLAINSKGVLVSGADNGTIHLWDFKTGYNFQRLQSPVQPGSMDSEAGIHSINFDRSGTRMITTNADKTIKMYKEDESANEETHAVNWRPDIIKRKKY